MPVLGDPILNSKWVSHPAFCESLLLGAQQSQLPPLPGPQGPAQLFQDSRGYLQEKGYIHWGEHSKGNKTCRLTNADCILGGCAEVQHHLVGSAHLALFTSLLAAEFRICTRRTGHTDCVLRTCALLTHTEPLWAQIAVTTSLGDAVIKVVLVTLAHRIMGRIAHTFDVGILRTDRTLFAFLSVAQISTEALSEDAWLAFCVASFIAWIPHPLSNWAFCATLLSIQVVFIWPTLQSFSGTVNLEYRKEPWISADLWRMWEEGDWEELAL